MINLLFCGNSYVFDGVLTCMLSILKRSKEDTYRIHIMTMDLTRIKETYTAIDEKMVAFLDEVVKRYNPQNEVIAYDVTALYEEKLGHSPNEGCYCSPYTLLRLLADQFPDLCQEKLLYLDCDVMFNRDIHLLYDTDLNGYEYAASGDHYGKYLIPFYINAGVLLFNMPFAIQNHLFEKARNWINKKKLPFADQSALIRSTTKRRYMKQKFNDQKYLHKKTVVRHFSQRLFYLPYPHIDNIKQWDIERIHRVFHYHQFDDIYEEYKKLLDEFQERHKNNE